MRSKETIAKEALGKAITEDFLKLKKDYPLLDAFSRRIRFSTDYLLIKAKNKVHLNLLSSISDKDAEAKNLVQGYQKALADLNKHEARLYIPPERREEGLSQDMEALIANDNNRGLQDLIGHLGYSQEVINQTNNALRLAAAAGAIQCLQSLLNPSPIANVLSQETLTGNIPLYYAIDKGKATSVAILLTATTPEGEFALDKQLLFGTAPHRPIDRLQTLENLAAKQQIILQIRNLLSDNKESYAVPSENKKLILSLLPLPKTYLLLGTLVSVPVPVQENKPSSNLDTLPFDGSSFV